MQLNELTIQEAAAGIRKKELSVTELVSACMDEITRSDNDIHAYLDVFDEAHEEARKKDEELAGYDEYQRAKLPPLFGIPLAIKDNILIDGKRCTAGSRMLKNYVASYDATVIKKLKKQGAIFLGKTNMDEFAMGSSTEHSAFGPTKNPRDLSRVPGGSSGGSAAAVASHMCLGALGSDTGGSIRQPAAFCGTVGMKPTYGRISRHGVIPMAASLNQIGPMAKSVADTEMLFDAIAGPDAFDANAYDRSQDAGSTKQELKNIKNLKIGVPREYFGVGLDRGVEKVIRDVLQKMEDAGAILEDISLPHSSAALPAYYIVVPCEISADLARFDGIRYGHHASDGGTLTETYTCSRAEGFGPEVKRRIMLGTYALSAGYYDAYYVKAQKARMLIRQDFEKAFTKVDIIAGPTTPTPAFALGERNQDPLQMYLADIYTVAVNLAGVPALSLSAGNIVAGNVSLPVGLQLIAPRDRDARLFSIARSIEALV